MEQLLTLSVHLISAPLALASESFAPDAWTRFHEINALKTIKKVQGSCKTVDFGERRALIETRDGTVDIEYDFFVAASGLRRVWPVVPQSTFKEKYLEEAQGQIHALENAGGVVVVGGGRSFEWFKNDSDIAAGAVGIEMAAEVKLVHPRQKVTLIHSRDKLCSSEPLPDDFKDQCLTALHEAGVETIMGQRVVERSSVDGGHRLKLANGRIVDAGMVIYAISKSEPSTSYFPKDSLDEEGYVKITPR